jgi:hypothetical protein
MEKQIQEMVEKGIRLFLSKGDTDYFAMTDEGGVGRATSDENLQEAVNTLHERLKKLNII